MEATREKERHNKVLQTLEGEGSIMCEARTDVVHVVVDHSTTHSILILTEEAEDGTMGLGVEAMALLLWTDVEFYVLLVVDSDDHSTIGHVILLLTI
jgi:hypothetical protein